MELEVVQTILKNNESIESHKKLSEGDKQLLIEYLKNPFNDYIKQAIEDSPSIIKFHEMIIEKNNYSNNNLGKEKKEGEDIGYASGINLNDVIQFINVISNFKIKRNPVKILNKKLNTIKNDLQKDLEDKIKKDARLILDQLCITKFIDFKIVSENQIAVYYVHHTKIKATTITFDSDESMIQFIKKIIPEGKTIIESFDFLN